MSKTADHQRRLRRRLAKELRGRTRRPGYTSRLKAATVAFDSLAAPAVNEQAMMASAVVVTPVVDREGDIIVPQGAHLDNYARNPVVLWDHGMEGYTLPVGVSRGPDGNLAVRVTEESIEADCYFAQSSAEASKLFELIAEDVLRGTSVQAAPLSAPVRSGGALRWEDWDFVEWSWTAIGVNPEALRRKMEPNRWSGCESLKKSLLPYAAPKPAAVGWTPEIEPEADMPTVKEICALFEKADAEDKAALLKSLGVTPLNKSTLKKAMDEMSDEERRALLADPAADPLADPAAAPAAGAVDPEVVAEDVAEVIAEMPLGAEVLQALVDSESAAVEAMKASLAKMENPEVISHMESRIAEMQKAMNEDAGLFEKCYGEKGHKLKMPEGLGSGDLPDEEEEPKEDEVLAKFLSASRLRRLEATGIAARVKMLAKDGKLTKGQRARLQRIESDLSDMVARAQREQAPVPDDLMKRLDAMASA